MWKPLFDDSETKDRFLGIISAIASDLSKVDFARNGSYGLHSGASGVSILYAYLARYSGDGACRYQFDRLNNLCLAAIGAESTHPTFSSGYPGMSWAFQHMMGNSLWSADSGILDSVDEYVMAGSRMFLSGGEFDFMHGGLGGAVYFLERLPSSPASAGRLEEIVGYLDLLAIRDGHDIYWKSTEFESRREILNLGLSHGMPSILAILSMVHRAGISRDTCRGLIEGNVRWMLRQELTAGSASVFPCWVGYGEASEPSPTRLSWCYGDMGVAFAMLHAAEALGNADWKSYAVTLMLACTARTSPEREGINDAGLCHGAISIAHLYNRFHQYTGIPEFRDAAVHWYGELLNYHSHPDGYGGFKAFRQDEPLTAEAGLLEGSAGIALGLLAAISDIEPAWDRCLLIS